MYDAGTLANIGLYSSVASGAANTYGSVVNAQNARRTATANAALEEQAAADAITRGQQSEMNQRLKTAQLKGTQTARLAASGVALDEGSPLAILTSTDVMGEADAATIRENAQKEANNYRTRASNDRAQADASNPWAAGISSLLSSTATVADRWYSYKKTQK